MSSEAITSFCSRTPTELRWGARLSVFGLLLSCVFLTGCIVAPIPMSKRLETPGDLPQRTAPDLSRLHAGQSTRQDVLEKLSVIDTGYSSEGLFFGRWVSSGSGWVWMIAGGNTGQGGYWRNWRVHNVFVTFNKDGNVMDVQEVDDRQLLKTVAGLPASEPQVPLAMPIEMENKCRWRPVTLVLKPDSIVFDHPDPPKIYSPVVATEIVKLSLIRGHHPDTGRLHMQIDFQSKTTLGRRIKFAIAPADAVRLAQYLQSTTSGTVIFR